MQLQIHQILIMKGFKFFLLIMACARISLGQWEIALSDSNNYTAVHFINDSTGFVCGNSGPNGIILKTVDYGMTWDTVYYAPQYFYDIHFPSDSIGFVSGFGSVFKTSDFGNTWVDPDLTENNQYFESVFFLDDNTGYGAGSGSLLAFGKTNDSGITWQINEDVGAKKINTELECQINFISGGYFGTSIDCLDSQINQLVNANNNRSLIGLCSFEGNIFCTGLGVNPEFNNFGFIGRKSVGSDEWSVIDFPNSVLLSAVDFPSTNFGVIVGQSYYGLHDILFVTLNSGDSWHYQEIEPLIGEQNEDYYPALNDVDCTSDSYCYAVGNGIIYRTSNGGGITIGEAIVTNVDNINSKTGLILFPNPATNGFFLSCPAMHLGEKVEWKLIDVAGKSAISGTSIYSNPLSIDTRGLASGAYYLQLQCEKWNATKAVVLE